MGCASPNGAPTGAWDAGRRSAPSPAYLNLPRDPEALAAVELRPAPSGAPQVFLHGKPAPVVLSLSHSGGTGFCVVAPPGAEVGCDLERVEPRSPAFLADYFTDEERQVGGADAGRQAGSDADLAVEREGKRAESAALRASVGHSFGERRSRPDACTRER